MFFIVLQTLFLASCTANPEPAVTLRGRLSLEVEPNPIIATRVGEDLYELKFDIIMREEGGVGVTIEDFTVDAIAFKAVTVRSQTFPASYITERGYPASIAAGKYLRFGFVKRWQLPTHLLLSGASARITAGTIDDNRVRATTSLRVGVVVGSAPAKT